MTQCARILKILRLYRGAVSSHGTGWCSLPLIQNPGGEGQIMQYNARIRELRHGKHDGVWHDIQNKTKVVNGVRHSWYRIVE
jgi:hypothetical protein